LIVDLKMLTQIQHCGYHIPPPCYLCILISHILWIIFGPKKPARNEILVLAFSLVTPSFEYDRETPRNGHEYNINGAYEVSCTCGRNTPIIAPRSTVKKVPESRAAGQIHGKGRIRTQHLAFIKRRLIYKNVRNYPVIRARRINIYSRRKPESYTEVRRAPRKPFTRNAT